MEGGVLEPVDIQAATDGSVLAKVKEELLSLVQAAQSGEPTVCADGETRIWTVPPSIGSPRAKTRTVTTFDVSPEEAIRFLVEPDNWIKNKLDPGLVKAALLESKTLPNGDLLLVRSGEWNVGWPLWNRE
jgi:hypothetical protein